LKIEQTFSSFESPNVFQVTQEMIFSLPTVSTGPGLIESIGEGLEIVGSELRMTIETLPVG